MVFETMEYDPIYHVTCRLQLESGRKLILNQLEQSQTYAGQSLGAPSKWSNDRKINNDLSRAAGREYTLGEPHLIPPHRRDYEYEPGDREQAREAIELS